MVRHDVRDGRPVAHPESEAGRREQLAVASAGPGGRAAFDGKSEADENVPDVALREQIATRLREREGAEATLDMRSSGALNKVTSSTVSKCLPHGTKKPFPKNFLSLMTQSGAKGSMVNFSQIAACLGQQELEGRRVPRMTSGKTAAVLPAPRHRLARAGGYIQIDSSAAFARRSTSSTAWRAERDSSTPRSRRLDRDTSNDAW